MFSPPSASDIQSHTPFIPHLPPVGDSLALWTHGSSPTGALWDEKGDDPSLLLPRDLVITGRFPEKSDTDSPLSYHQHHQACQLSTTGRLVLVTRPPPACLIHGCTGSQNYFQMPGASREFSYFVLISDKPRAAALPSFPCFNLLDLREEELCWLGPSLCCWNIPGIDLLVWVGRLEEIPLAAIQNCLHVLWHPSLLYPSSLEVTLYPLYQGWESHELCDLCTSQTCIHTVFSKIRVRSFPSPTHLRPLVPRPSALPGKVSEWWECTVPGVLMGSLLSSITKIPHKVVILIFEDRFPFVFKIFFFFFDVDNF